jgi:NADH-quinone oxidoreductase subunit H
MIVSGAFKDFMMELLVGIILLILKLAFVLVGLLIGAGWLTWGERRLLGFFQIRLGPNRAGPVGLLQPVADIVKLLTKEDLVPEAGERWIFLYAPAVVAMTAMVIFAVVPFANDWIFLGRPFPMVIDDLNVGLLFVLALSSISVYGVALGGWASNSKFSLLGGVRGAAQMISYELSMGLALVPVVMLARSFSLVDIVEAQARFPFILIQPVAFLIFFISAMAEVKRIPFDLPEAENELVAGYHTEYSGMRFGLYFLGEYVAMVVLGALVAVFFLGGWRGPFLPSIVWFFGKVTFIVYVQVWLRATFPRLRYDQLMHMGWKVLIPAALLNIIVTGAVILMIKG